MVFGVRGKLEYSEHCREPANSAHLWPCVQESKMRALTTASTLSKSMNLMIFISIVQCATNHFLLTITIVSDLI